MSTIMPRRFISRTTSLPKSVKPLCAALPVEESAHSTSILCVSVMYRTPSDAYVRSTPRSLLIMCPPSTPISAAIFPCFFAARTSAAVVASTMSFGCFRTCSRTAPICAVARLTASGPVTLPDIQMEKKIPSSPPSFIRGMSMLPSEWRTPRSNFGSSSRCVVSSWVSTTIAEWVSFFAFSETESAATLIAIRHPLAKIAAIRRSFLSILIHSPPFLLLRLHFVADFSRLLHDAQQIPTQNFANIVVAVAFAHQRLRNLRQVRAVVHSFGHRGTVEVGAKADVVRTGQLHHVIDVVDDLFP